MWPHANAHFDMPVCVCTHFLIMEIRHGTDIDVVAVRTRHAMKAWRVINEALRYVHIDISRGQQI